MKNKNITIVGLFFFLLSGTNAYSAGLSSQEDVFHDYVKSLLVPSKSSRRSGFVLGKRGNGKLSPTYVKSNVTQSARQIAPLEFGPSLLPFSTVRADLSEPTNTLYPYRAIGKVFVQNGEKTLTCGGTLIKPGLVLTAAHCVTKAGIRRFYDTRIKFIPGYRGGEAPYGVWYGRPFVLRAYFDGTTPCDETLRICQDDVAILNLEPQGGKYPGEATGWLGYGWNGHGFTPAGLVQVAQVGYPGCLNDGEYMQRNDAQGYQSSSFFNNTIIGSLMCGGASGGPWVVNFGFRPSVKGTTFGEYPDPNVIVGVTSWVNTDLKHNGASPFLNSNVAGMVNAICNAAPQACNLH